MSAPLFRVPRGGHPATVSLPLPLRVLFIPISIGELNNLGKLNTQTWSTTRSKNSQRRTYYKISKLQECRHHETDWTVPDLKGMTTERNVWPGIFFCYKEHYMDNWQMRREAINWLTALYQCSFLLFDHSTVGLYKNKQSLKFTLKHIITYVYTYTCIHTYVREAKANVNI